MGDIQFQHLPTLVLVLLIANALVRGAFRYLGHASVIENQRNDKEKRTYQTSGEHRPRAEPGSSEIDGLRSVRARKVGERLETNSAQWVDEVHED